MSATIVSSDSATPPRVGLVLGAGGYLGAAWLAGALFALHDEIGWDARTADYVIGTSAGAVIGALCAVGNGPARVAASMAAPASGGDDWWRADHPRRLWPGSPSLGLATLRDPAGKTALGLLAGWLPRGRHSTEPFKRLIRTSAPSGWRDRPGLWVVASDYQSGARRVFRSEADDDVELADVVAASCAVPGIYRPVLIDGREFVDGALRSSSNLDVVRDLDLDLVVCLNPSSCLSSEPAVGAPSRIGQRLRRAATRRVAREAAIVTEAGTDVALIEPTRRDRDAMGWNQLGRGRAAAVVHTAVATTTEQVSRTNLGERLGLLTHARADERVDHQGVTAMIAVTDRGQGAIR